MPFTKEADFEEALIRILSEKGWEREVLRNYTEEQLIKNWADILFANNRGIDQLNDYPLTDGEMGQILEQVRLLKTPMRLNGFINGKEVTIIRDHPEDTAHFGKEVSLKIYDRREIAAGQSRYQIAQQPKFPISYVLLDYIVRLWHDDCEKIEKEERLMTITATEFKSNLGKYLVLAETEDIFISKNGKVKVKLVSNNQDRIKSMESIFGCIPPDVTLEEAREERLSKI